MTAWWRRRRAQVQQAEPVRLPAVAMELCPKEWAQVREAVAEAVLADRVIWDASRPTLLSSDRRSPVVQVEVLVPYDLTRRLVSQAAAGSPAERRARRNGRSR